MSKKQIYYCLGCGERHGKRHFYMSTNPLHKNGVIPFCKTFIMEHCTYDDGTISLERFQNILRQVDKPFLKAEWESALEEEGRNAFGAYFSRINMAHNQQKTWEDSTLNLLKTNKDDEKEDEGKKTYSKRWHGYYTKRDLDYLDNYLEQLMNDYDIDTVNRQDYAKKIAKTSLMVDKLYAEVMKGNTGVVRQLDNTQKIFDNLSKSAEFAQSKAPKNDGGVQSLSELIAKVEAEEYPYMLKPSEKDKDIYDKLLDQFSNINKSLE